MPVEPECRCLCHKAFYIHVRPCCDRSYSAALARLPGWAVLIPLLAMAGAAWVMFFR